MNGWILLHKKIWDNQLFLGNPYALTVWVWLLTHCDYEGAVKCGRNQIAKDTGVKSETVRYWLTRFLQENHQLVTIKTTNKFSVYRICNWNEYQRKTTNSSTANLPATYQPPTTNKEERIKKKEVSNDTVETRAQVQRVYDHFINLFKKNSNQYRLTDKRKAKLRSRLKDAGEEMLLKAISNVASSKFYMGDNDRGWTADLDFIIKSYEQVERLAAMESAEKIVEYQADW